MKPTTQPLTHSELDSINASLRRAQWEGADDIRKASGPQALATAVRNARRVLAAAKAMLQANRRALRALEAV